MCARDRLHVAILPTILGKDTVLYPDPYYKNRGVYEFSLSKYPNVKFVNDLKNFEAILKRAWGSVSDFELPRDIGV